MKLAYTGYSEDGKAVSGVVEAAGPDEARSALRRQGVFATEVKSAGKSASPGASAGTSSSGRSRFRAGRGARLKRTASMMKQMSLLVASGTPVVDALAAVERQAQDASWKSVVGEVRCRVEEGSALSDAMRANPEQFDAICASLVAAGESGASLDGMLARLAQTLEREAQMRGAILGAMIYPLVLITASTAALVTLVLVVLPRFAKLFETLQVPLPATTQMLIILSNFMRSWWWAALAGFAAIVVGVFLWARSEQGRRRLHHAAVVTPQLGRIVRSFATARIARLLGILVCSHVPLVEAIRLVRDSLWNTRYIELLREAEERVIRGEPIGDAFSNPLLIEPAIAEVIRTGERSGQLGAVLTNIAGFKDQENETIIRSLTSLLEPIILLFMGGIVALVAISMFLPLFDLAGSTGGGP